MTAGRSGGRGLVVAGGAVGVRAAGADAAVVATFAAAVTAAVAFRVHGAPVGAPGGVPGTRSRAGAPPR